ncbi:Peptidase M16 [Lasiodiplodia theobromae]|uniref:Presequence protease, mitochondrial n=1 Tax=Lasiodiplodia theobromae TaxID=45133 RepID=A0A5N5DMT4_9PEZI|nr:Mitochondrial presequence protease [Lasiodiplodia theobromae]KAB2578631.1 Mitochondrial presequence protease [Lasiodiplodia theobromae]KAF4538516.1 Mitochondrial presequence protease [Lasiodiplodia theobromae]KAF9640631.1 Peptidase M16 [Lasiodiplodia theobromae]
MKALVIAARLLFINLVVMLRASSRPALAAVRTTAPFLRASAASCRGLASATGLHASPKVGSQLHGFTLRRVKHVPELELTALHLQHDKTGADYLHVARDDSNNVFSIGFKTNPPDDTGVPHILEHTTLCGSERYPVRDPFFKMLPRSLSNFMNAFTSSDHTTYPFATTNPQDFKNLMSVYLDATLHPLLKANDFTQEGWRIGPENPLEPASEDNQLAFKGVVYNEMKGQMSDASYLYYIRFQDHIFPDINNSGGDPQKITDLTHEQLKKFHADHYHPSNAKVFTYGDIPLDEHLRDIGAQLDKFGRIRVDTDIKLPISLDGPKTATVKGPIDPLVPADMQYKTSTSWLMGDSSNILETFSLGVLSSLLLDGYGSPLYRGLIEAGLGPDWSPNTGYDGSGKVGIFSIGLNGVKKDDVPKVKEAIFRTLAEAKENGFSQTKVDGILHQLELALKHKTAHFGMGLMQRLKPGWFNGVDPFDALAWNEVVDAFKAEYAKGGYLEGLLEKYLLNDNTFTFTMEPSETYAREIAEEESERLASKILETTRKFGTEEEAKKFLEQRELELLEEQENGRKQDLGCLPTVHVKDIPRQREKKDVRQSRVEDVKVQWREAPTNGLTYFRAVNVFEDLPDELREMIPLFSDAIMRLGTKDKTMEQLEELIKLKTGGISIGYHSTTTPTNIQGFEEGLVFAGSALDRNVPAMYDLLRTLITETDFDGPEAEKQIRQLLQASASGAVNAVAESGHAYARRYAEAGITPAARLREQTAGLTQVKLTTNLASRSASESFEDVMSKLKTLQSLAISNSKNLRVALTCGAESSASNEEALTKFLATLPANKPEMPTVSRLTTFSRNAKSFFPLPYQVYYSGLSIPTVPYVSSDGAPLQILAQLLTHKHLHHEIREKGGAYGGGAYANGLGGIFGFYSYRDPNPQNTIKIINESGVWARDRAWTDRDIEEAKLSVFQSLDAPESVSQEGMHKFLNGVDDEMQQKRREQLLDVTAEDVKRAAQDFLVNGVPKGNLAVLGEKKEWVKEDWTVNDLHMVQDAVGGADGSA